jgi:DNA polymerase
MGSVGAYRNLAPKTTLTDKEIKNLQKQWHALHPETVKFWYALDRSAKAAITAPNNTIAANDKIAFVFDGKCLWMILPSGRRIAYPNAHLKKTDREDTVVFFDNATGGWRECRKGRGAYGGTWIENAVQGIARDIFAAAMLRLDEAGFQICMQSTTRLLLKSLADLTALESSRGSSPNCRIGLAACPFVQTPGWARGSVK